MRLTRGKHILFLDSSMNGTTVAWYKVGKDIEEMSVDLAPDTETVKNILDETSFRHNGYEESIEADPYYADPDDALYEPLKNIAMNRLKGDELKTKMLEVLIEDTADTSHDAWQQDCYIVPQSVGGDTSGLQIPFNVYPVGTRVKGSATITKGVPAFTPQ